MRDIQAPLMTLPHPHTRPQNLAYFTTTLTGELSRHVGRAVGAAAMGPGAYAGTAAGGANNGSKYFAFEAPAHLPTVRFFGGLLCLLRCTGLAFCA